MPNPQKLPVGRSELERFGRTLVRYVVEEAKKDAQKSSFIPANKEFYDSFTYRVNPDGSVTVSSNWPWVDLLVVGSRPYPMKWLTKAQGVAKVPFMGKDGQLLIRSTPLTTDKAWIHPAIARHTFIQRAFDRAREEFMADVADKALRAILGKVFGG